MTIHIRPETAADLDAIRQVNVLAFDGDEEAHLVDALRAGGYVRLSLVAENGQAVVGHILFSRLSIMTSSGAMSALSLAPLAVLPAQQRRGIGSELVQRGLAECTKQDHRVVIVLGHPAFYRRFGFSSELARPLESPFSGDPWMAMELVPGALKDVAGKVVYPPPFGID